MKHKNIILWAGFALLSTLDPQLSTAFAQSPSFTYQGRLDESRVPASGLFDLVFTLHDHPTNAATLGTYELLTAVPVSNGLFTVTLNVRAPFGPGAFDGADRWLEIGVRRNGVLGNFTVLSPRQPLTSTPYAIRAASAGAAQSVTGPVPASQITGTLAATNLAPGAAAANLAASGLAGVPSGTVVLSDREVNLSLLAAGFQPMGLSTLNSNETWTTQPAGPPATGALDPGRHSHRAVWTGTEVMFIGGTSDHLGLRYNPSANTWSVMNKTNAPAIGEDVHAFWSGTQLLVWDAYNRVGGRYTPGTDTWTVMSDVSAPDARAKSCAAFVNGYLVVWGGKDPDGSTLFRTGGRYNPANNTWTATATSGAPAARAEATATAIGTDLIVFGGWGTNYPAEICNPQNPADCFTRTLHYNYDGGARYNPAANSWSPIAASPAARYGHSATWSGTHLLVWGGQRDALYLYYTGGFPNPTYLTADSYVSLVTEGFRYNPASDSWSPLSTNGSPKGVVGHSAVWSGSSLVVWGGTTAKTNYYVLGQTLITLVFSSGKTTNSGARYTPGTDTWTPLSATSVESRDQHPAIWTGTQMVFWGGRNDDGDALSDGRRYTLASDTWATTATPPSSGEPGPRHSPSAVWTGSELIVWGGQNGGTSLRSGGVFRPGLGWTNTPDAGAPSARFDHTAVWTGTEMIVWGGYGIGSPLDTGARFNVASNRWFPVSTINAPRRRTQHAAVWTGTEMIIFGGYDRTNLFNPSWLNSAARYQPATDTWQAISNNLIIFPRAGSSAVWTGTEMLVWGGYQHSGGFFPTFSFFNSGYRFNPATGLWATLPASGLAGRRSHSAVWSGTEMLIWGGETSTGPTNTGARYHAGSNVWTAISVTNSPGIRYDHTAVWAEPPGQMIILCGNTGTFTENDGKLYDPLTDKWTSMLGLSARDRHIAVWTGRNMLAFDGYNGSADLDSGAAYKPRQTFFYYQKP